MEHYINIAILGGVSVGKSTLLNCLLGEYYSPTSYCRTTMTPQIYYESLTNIDDPEYIMQNNMKLNSDNSFPINNTTKRLSDHLSSSMFLTSMFLTSTRYNVPKISDFVELHPGVGLAIHDIPGLNDSVTKETHCKYVKDNFHNFDVVIFVLDICSAMNTGDQMDMLKFILTCIRSKYEEFDCETKFIVLINKCDDMTVQDGYPEMDNDMKNMFDQAKGIIDQTVHDIFVTPDDTHAENDTHDENNVENDTHDENNIHVENGTCCKLQYNIIPISCELAYIYRMQQSGKSEHLDKKHLNRLGTIEFGKAKWMCLDETMKMNVIKELTASDIEKQNMITMTGYNQFKKLMCCILTDDRSDEIQCKILKDHIFYNLKILHHEVVENMIIQCDQKSISKDLDNYYNILSSVNKINELFNIEEDAKDWELIKTYVESYIELYNNTYVEKHVGGFPVSVPNIDILNEIKETYIKLQQLFPVLFNRYKDLNQSICESIDQHYIIKLNETVSFNQGIEYLAKIPLNNFTDFKKTLHRFITTSDLSTKKSDEMIDCLTKIKGLYEITNNEMLDISFDLLDTIYSKELMDQYNANKYFEKSKFWHEIVIKSTNRYSGMIHRIRIILINGIGMYQHNNENNEVCDKFENYLYDQLKTIYPLDIYKLDDLINVTNLMCVQPNEAE
jgi:GTPase SAR1 family protein